MVNNNKNYGLLAGLFLPIIGFIYALFHPNNKSFKLLFVLFFTFVGLAFFYMEGTDASRYVDAFLLVAAKRDISFLEYFRSIAYQQQIDHYFSFMQWFVSRFTKSPQIYMGFLALLCSMFFVGNVSYIIKRVNTEKRIVVFLLIVLIVTPKIIFITHRWWMALQVFLFGLLPVVFEKKYWKLLWCFAAAFVFHFSFLYPLIIFVVSLLLPQKTLWLYLALYIFSATANSFDFNSLTPYVESFFPDLVAARTESYINYELQEHNLFSQSAKIVTNFANIVLCTIVYFTNRKGLKQDDLICRFYVIALMIGSFASIVSLTEWGWRFLDLSNMIFVVFYLVYLSNDLCYNKSLALFKCVSPLFLYFIVFQIRGFLTIIGPNNLFLGNYFTTWFLKDSASVFDIIKGL